MQPAQPSMLETFFPLVIILVVMYFLMIRPQSRRLKVHETFLKNLNRGDQVVTSSGILGTIDGLTDQVVTLEIASGVKVKVLRKQIASSVATALAATTPATPAPTETKKA